METVVMHIRLSREVVERLKKEAAIERLRSASGLAARLIEKGLSNGAVPVPSAPSGNGHNQ